MIFIKIIVIHDIILQYVSMQLKIFSVEYY